MLNLHSIMPWWLRFWFVPVMGLFAAGADVLGSLGSSDGAIVGSEESSSESGETAGGSESTSEGASEEEGAAPATKPAVKVGPELTKPLNPKAKTFLNELKENDHEAWKDISTRLWAKNTADKQLAEHFPERGLQEAIELKSTVDGLLTRSAAKSLGEIEEELSDIRDTDTKLINGDPSFVNNLPPEARTGIFKMMPHFLNEWGTEDPDGYERHHAGVFTATMRDSQVPLQLRDAIRECERMGLDSADVKFVHDNLKAIEKFLGDVKAKAESAPASKDDPVKDPQVAEREQKVAQGERKLALGRVGSGINETAGPIMIRTLNTLIGKRQDVNKGEVLVRARRELGNVLGKAFDERLGQFLDAGDEAGAIKSGRQQMTEGKLVEAVTKAFKYLYGAATLGSPKTKQKVDGQGGGAPAAAAGFAKIKYNPKPSSIDLAASDKLAKELGLPNRNRLFAQNKAVLKGGKKVTWDQEAEGEE